MAQVGIHAMAGLAAVAAAAAALLVADTAEGHSCTCRNRDGRNYQLGQQVCLNVDGRRYLARCEMKLNNSSWTKMQDGCPLARMDTPPQAAQSAWLAFAWSQASRGCGFDT